MAILAGIEYERKPGYPKERMDNQRIIITDKIQCEWNSRLVLAKNLMGYVGGTILKIPHKYEPDGDETLNNLYCTAVDIEPLGELPTNTAALLTLTYSQPEYNTEQPPEQGVIVYVSEAIEPASEFITLSHDGLHWSSISGTSLEPTEAPSKIVRMVDWVYTIHHLSYLPSWIWSYPGCVNNYSLYSYTLGVTFPAETLLCGNPSSSREITSEGVTAWTITIRFTYNPNTWNKFPRVGTGGDLTYEYIYDATGIKYVYPLADFGGIVY